MREDILQKIEKGLGITEHVPVIDPNTQQPKTDKQITIDDAAVPAILAGLYKKTRTAEGANDLITHNGSSIFEILFGEQSHNVAKSVANYAKVSEADSYNEMQSVADITRDYVVNNLKNEKPDALMNFFTNQRKNILTHLPPDLNMGEFLKDPTLDDRTNKMEGPMSGIMHSIEKIFSSTK